jgi:pseudouridine-5'-monophosphatase
MKHGTPVKHVIFDMDGVLLDTEIIYTRITQQIVGRFGKTYDWSIKGLLIGRPSTESAKDLVAMLDLPISPQQYIDERNDLLKEAFPYCEPMPGAEKLVRHLHRQGIPVAVATSSNRDLFATKTTRHQEWFSLFDQVVTGDDPEIGQGKPAPDIFLVTASRIGASPVSTIVFEDAPSGLAAGIAAGMRVIAVPDPNMEKARYAGADRILDSLEQFDPVEYGLSPY